MDPSYVCYKSGVIWLTLSKEADPTYIIRMFEKRNNFSIPVREEVQSMERPVDTSSAHKTCDQKRKIQIETSSGDVVSPLLSIDNRTVA